VLTVALFFAALLGVPLFAVIATGALAGFWQAGVDPAIVAIEFYRLAEMPVLVAIPLFTLAGYLLGESGAPHRLVRLSRAWLGWLPGGTAVMALVTSAFFTAFTGASGITIIALGALLYPALAQAGYGERFRLGLITTSGSLGLLFAPALPLILYAVIAGQVGTGGDPVSVDAMFRAGVLPGLLMLLALAIFGAWAGRGQALVPFRAGEGMAALHEARFDLPLPILVLGGIYGGTFAISEAAAVTAAYVLLVHVLWRREIPFRRLPGVIRAAMSLVGAILVILGASLASTNLLIDQGVPQALLAHAQTLFTDRLSFLLALNLLLLALGMLLDIFSALVLIVPLLLPIAAGYGVHPVHLGILFLANMQLGYLTPPVGMNLFIASHRFGRDILTLYRATLPFFLILLAVVLVITYWPGLSLALL
jgi:tripartite ATP-independent transporter DctM subunit